MTPVRLTSTLAVAAAAALALSACGSDNNSGSGSSGGATSGATSGSGSSSSSGGSSASGGITCASGTLQAAGSTAQTTAISTWTKAFQSACSGATVNYNANGSGAGVTAFENKTVDFAGSDYALTSANKPAADKACASGGAIDLPMVAGGIALGYNLPGVTTLKLSAPVIAQIFSGKITKWDDPAIAKDNSGTTLPSTTIQTFHRSDASGTSFNFTNYLSNVAKADWTYGVNKAWPAPGGQSAKGSSGVAQAVKSTAGAIGYFEDSFAKQAGIPEAQVGRGDGSFAELTGPNVTAFLAHATQASGATGSDLPLQFDYTATDGYPITLVTYEIVCAAGNKNAGLLKDFLTYTSGTGQPAIANVGYVALPQAIVSKVASAVSSLS